MPGRAELMEAALSGHPEGIALLDDAGQVMFWNHAAETTTGFAGIEVVARATPWALEGLLHGNLLCDAAGAISGVRVAGVELVHGQHKLGGNLSLSARRVVLRNDLGARIGTAVLFHRVEYVKAFPHGDPSLGGSLDSMHPQIEAFLLEQYEKFLTGTLSFGLLWLSVDQAMTLRRTHGARAYEAMLDRMERTLAGGLRPGEELGRWNEGEFLILAQSPDVEELKLRAHHVAGLARTADFRWWGDRLSLTVSVGAAMARPAELLVTLLERAQAAMYSSLQAGGNQVMMAQGGQECLQS